MGLSGRPREFEDLATTSIKVPMELIKNCRAIGLNISDICRVALVRAVNSPRAKELQKIQDKFKEVPVHFLGCIDRYVTKDPNKKEIWTNIINKKCGTKLTPQDILDYANRKK